MKCSLAATGENPALYPYANLLPTDVPRTGSFDWTTDDPKISYVDSDGPHIVPTLTLETTNITEAELLDGYNFFTDGTFSSIDWRRGTC